MLGRFGRIAASFAVVVARPHAVLGMHCTRPHPRDHIPARQPPLHVLSRARHAVQQRLDELSPGRLVSGRVAKLVPFGAVVRLADGLEGLLHVSQVSRLYVQNVSEVLTRGEELTCVVLKVDLADGSLALSTKMLESRPGEMLDDRAALLARSSQIEGRVELRQ